MHFERTTDYVLVREILTDPRIYPHVGDDFAPAPEHFVVNDHPAIRYVLVRHGLFVIGLFTFCPQNDICWQVHVAMRRGVLPCLTHRAGRAIIPWLWEQTPCRRLIACVPVTNRAAVRFGLRVMGLHPFGVNRKSFLKHGQLVDQVLMGSSRPQ